MLELPGRCSGPAYLAEEGGLRRQVPHKDDETSKREPTRVVIEQVDAVEPEQVSFERPGVVS